MQPLKYELNIAIIPDLVFANKCIITSQTLASKYPAVIQLNDVQDRLAFAPHLTLYQVAVPHENMQEVLNVIREIAQSTKIQSLRASRFAYNSGEGSFEARYKINTALLELQRNILDGVGPLREGLLVEKDPGGNKVNEFLEAPGALSHNIRQTGFAEVGDPAKNGLFRPHITLNWFDRGVDVDEESADLPAISSLDGSFTQLGVYLLGPFGTCAQRLGQFPLS